jgi:XTP/dITP diphosphohydrolase
VRDKTAGDVIVSAMTALVIATRNQHKVQEIRAILGAGRRCLSLADFPEAPKVVEDASTFSGNAVKKARGLAAFLQGIPDLDFRVPGVNALVVSDDSGLEVDALQGAPGVHSARFAAGAAGTAAGNAPDAANNMKLLKLLGQVPREKRSARFRCAIASFRIKPRQPTLAAQIFEGVCEGRIELEPRGRGGFGYDPLFVPTGQTASFAELKPELKNQLSHRAQALLKFRRYLEVLNL